MKLSHETVKRQLDEAPCDWCGAPVYVGDSVWYDLQRGMCFCSRRCAADEQKATAPNSCEFCPADGGGCCVCRVTDPRD